MRHTLAAMTGVHDHVVHVDEGPASEGGKTLHAVDEANGLIGVEGQDAEGLRSLGKRLGQRGLDGRVQRCASTGRVAASAVSSASVRRAAAGVRPPTRTSPMRAPRGSRSLVRA